MMEKEIKDYLHLYLPYSISVFVFTDDSISDGFLDKYRNDYPNGIYNPVLTLDNYKKFLTDGYKPILRPLSDMKDEEFIPLTELMPSEKDIDDDNTIIMLAAGAEVTKYLLKQHFDLFGLNRSRTCY